MEAIHRLFAAAFLATLSTSAQDAPVFRSGTRMVEVDVIVRSKDGFVAGLAKDQFTLEDNGRRQTIAVFNAPRPALTPAPLPPGAVSNRLTSAGEQPMGATVILIDRLFTPFQQQPFVYQQLRQLIQDRAGKDRIAIYVLDRSLRVLQELTGDQHTLEAAAATLTPQDIQIPVGDSPDTFVAAMRTRVTTLTRSMEEIARHLAQVPGRKNLIWISSSFPMRINGSRVSVDFTQQVARAMRVVSDAHVAVYPVDTRGLGTGAGLGMEAPAGVGACPRCGRALREPPNLSTLDIFADHTGGQAFYNGNGIAESAAKVASEGDQVYTLGFYPSDNALDGSFHKLRVRVAVPGVEVSARPGYLAVKSDAAAARLSPEDLLQTTLDLGEIGLFARTERGEEGQIGVQISADVHNLSLVMKDGRHTGFVDILVSSGSDSAAITVPIQLTEALFTEALAQPFGLTWLLPVAAKPDVSELRVIVQDRTTGAAGSIRIPLASK